MTDAETTEVEAEEVTTDVNADPVTGSDSESDVKTEAGTGTEAETETEIEMETETPGAVDREVTDRESSGPLGIDARRAFYWTALVTLSLVALVAVSALYSSVGRVIEVWVAERYQSIARTAYNLVVLSTTLVGISAVVRRLSEDE